MEKVYIVEAEWLDADEILDIVQAFEKYEINSILRLRLTGNLVIKVNKDIPFEEYLDIINYKEFIVSKKWLEIEDAKDVTDKYINQDTQDTFINQDGDIDSIGNYKSNKKFKKNYYDLDLPF